jgi:hypothetical protein
MTFAQRLNRLTTHFSEVIAVVKRSMTVDMCVTFIPECVFDASHDLRILQTTRPRTNIFQWQLNTNYVSDCGFMYRWLEQVYCLSRRWGALLERAVTTGPTVDLTVFFQNKPNHTREDWPRWSPALRIISIHSTLEGKAAIQEIPWMFITWKKLF